MNVGNQGAEPLLAAPQGEHKRALSAEGELAEAGPKGPRSEVLAREQALEYEPLPLGDTDDTAAWRTEIGWPVFRTSAG